MKLPRIFCLLLFVLLTNAFAYSQTTPQPSPTPSPKPAENKTTTTTENKTPANGTTTTTPATTTTEPAAKPVAAVEGAWDVDIDFNGQIFKAKLTITKEKDDYNGTLVSDAGEGSMKKATVTENSLEGMVDFTFYGQPVMIKIKATIDKDKMKGTLKPDNQEVGELPFTATKKQ